MITQTELAKIVYLDASVASGRYISLMPFWDGKEWHMWIEAPKGSIMKMKVEETIHGNYIAKDFAKDTDFWIEFVEVMYKIANWPEVVREISGIEDDIHHLATSVAKIRHYFDCRDRIDQDLMNSFVMTELEYIITVARSMFDLLQEAISKIWNDKVTLVDEVKNSVKSRHKLPDSFTKVAVEGRDAPRSVDELTEKYALPPVMAEEYHSIAPFYIELLKMRDKIVHGGGSVGVIFVTGKGFCVDPKGKAFDKFEWKSEHYYNDNIVSIFPWIANVVFGSIRACNALVGAIVASIALPPDITPGYRIFIRDPANAALAELAKVADGEIIWWSEVE